MHEEHQYLDLMRKVLSQGNAKHDRTEIGTLSLFGSQMRFNLRNSIPVFTTKKVFWRGIVEELLWFIRGETDSKLLEEKNVRIWKGNTSREFLNKRGLKDYPEGEIGPGYGWQWRNFNGSYSAENGIVHKKSNGIDQLEQVISTISNNPNDRRIIVSAWNPLQIQEMALPPCHLLFQFYVANNELSCQIYQRSCDLFLGVPFNVASYSLLTYLIAEITNLKPGDLIWTGGDIHIYNNHIEQVKQQMSREPHPFPKLRINKELKTLEDIERLNYTDLKLIDYKSHSKLSAEMAV